MELVLYVVLCYGSLAVVHFDVFMLPTCLMGLSSVAAIQAHALTHPRGPSIFMIYVEKLIRNDWWMKIYGILCKQLSYYLSGWQQERGSLLYKELSTRRTYVQTNVLSVTVSNISYIFVSTCCPDR